jgi:hypothetical protein
MHRLIDHPPALYGNAGHCGAAGEKAIVSEIPW